jgi:23S rRNA (cytosine1962-C5)-methyltransferase
VAESTLRRGHPWLFADSVTAQNRPGAAGELAAVFDQKDEFLAIGLYDPDSPIALRVLHAGKPRAIDDDWWAARWNEALSRRAGLFDNRTTGYRCVNGESDGWPGLVLDRYGETFEMKIYSAAWFPWLDKVCGLFSLSFPGRRLVLRLSRNIQTRKSGGPPATDSQTLLGDPLAGPAVFRESGLAFEADVLRGQKTGFFLDQRENRREVEKLAAGRTVLNAFSFSGGFSLYAARGGAARVDSLDLSAHALDSAKRNFALNSADPRVADVVHQTIQADAFAWLAAARPSQYDLVILDPPSMAPRHSAREAALGAYANLARQGARLLRPQGVLVAASCSAHVTAGEFGALVGESVRQVNGRAEQFLATGHGPDHPATFPEAQYLKCVYLRC